MSLTIPRADRSYNASSLVTNSHNFVIVFKHLMRKCMRSWKGQHWSHFDSKGTIYHLDNEAKEVTSGPQPVQYFPGLILVSRNNKHQL